MLAGQPARILLPHLSNSGRQPPAHHPFPSPLERNPQASKGWKKRETDGVGLAIVSALDNSAPLSHRPSKEQKPSPPKSIAARPVYPSAAAADFHVADFLSSCNLCRKTLHGQDIYMYRGEKAFCSMECRYKQIVSDECMEKYVSRALIRQAEISRSPCSGDRRQLFYAGIMAL